MKTIIPSCLTFFKNMQHIRAKATKVKGNHPTVVSNVVTLLPLIVLLSEVAQSITDLWTHTVRCDRACKTRNNDLPRPPLPASVTSPGSSFTHNADVTATLTSTKLQHEASVLLTHTCAKKKEGVLLFLPKHNDST